VPASAGPSVTAVEVLEKRSVPASWHSKVAASRTPMRVLAMTTPGHCLATLDGKDRHDPDTEDEGCHGYGSPNSAGRPAQPGAGRSSRSSRWNSETPISFVPSNCRGRVIPGGAETFYALDPVPENRREPFF